MKKIITLFFAALFFLSANVMLAQEEEKSDPTGWKKADKQYKQKGYMSSANNYQMKHDEEEMTPEVMLRVANSYRLNGESELAEYWYAKSINNTTDTEDKLHYAEVLQSNGKCEDAIRWFKEYKKTAKGKREFITDCSEIENFSNNENVEIENVKALNTKHLDYSAIPAEGGVMFTSTRGVQSASRMTDTWTKDNFSDVFFAASNDEGVLSQPRPLGSEINRKYHDGVTSLSEEGKIMYFSRNNSSSTSKTKVIDLKIYSATRTNKVWKNVTEVPINGDEYATCHPSVSANGKLLYFASDRPGGFGGMDIYVSKNENGIWQTPINLGPTVNTAGNEIFPFISPIGTLFFSSNGHKGLGGLDIFKVEKTDMEDELSWSVRANIGKPFNTKKDDFAFTGNAEMTKGFLTSNRPGGKGSDDIYEWKTKNNTPIEEEKSSIINLLVADKLSGNVLRNAIVTVTDENGVVIKNNAVTNSKGLFIQEVGKGKNYLVKVEKEGYAIMSRTINANELLLNESIQLDLEKAKCLELVGTVVNEKYKKGIPNANVVLENKCTGERTNVLTDTDGTFDFCLAPNCDFAIIASKNTFEETQTMVSTMGLDAEGGTRTVKMEMLPEVKTTASKVSPSQPVVTTNETVITPPKVITVPAKISTPTKATPIVSTPTTKTEVTSTKSSKKPTTSTTSSSSIIATRTDFKVGEVITLKNIYYDFDKFNIRLDASMELDQVVAMLKGNPKMEIRLTAHTDSRGDAEYNMLLSTKRSVAARRYLISKGIEEGRVKSLGFGESQLKNNCKDGIDCSDDEHQENRRTEVMIMK